MSSESDTESNAREKGRSKASAFFGKVLSTLIWPQSFGSFSADAFPTLRLSVPRESNNVQSVLRLRLVSLTYMTKMIIASVVDAISDYFSIW